MNWFEKSDTSLTGYGYSSCFDTLRQRTVFFGGFPATGGAATNLTYEFYGEHGYLVTTAHAPAARNGAAMAFDAARGLTVLYGGFLSTDSARDTWVYDGTDWTQKFPAHNPGFRASSMVYDAVNEVVVLQGGTADGVHAFNDTWTWDGTDWTQRFPAHEPPKQGDGVMLAWDPLNENVVFFGGSGGVGDGNDTWVWDGTDWTQKFPATSPQARRYGAFGGVSGFGAVLYGTWSQSLFTNLYDTWLWTGSDWVDLNPSFTPSVGFQQLDTTLAETTGHQAVFIVHGEYWDWTPDFGGEQIVFRNRFRAEPSPAPSAPTLRTDAEIVFNNRFRANI